MPEWVQVEESRPLAGFSRDASISTDAVGEYLNMTCAPVGRGVACRLLEAEVKGSRAGLETEVILLDVRDTSPDATCPKAMEGVHKSVSSPAVRRPDIFVSGGIVMEV